MFEDKTELERCRILGVTHTGKTWPTSAVEVAQALPWQGRGIGHKSVDHDRTVKISILIQFLQSSNIRYVMLKSVTRYIKSFRNIRQSCGYNGIKDTLALNKMIAQISNRLRLLQCSSSMQFPVYVQSIQSNSNDRFLRTYEEDLDQTSNICGTSQGIY